MDDVWLDLNYEDYVNLCANHNLARRRLASSNVGNPASRHQAGRHTRYRDGTLAIAGVTHRCIMAGSLRAVSVDRSEDTLE